MTKRLMNQGKRKIDSVFAPGTVAIFSDETAKKLMKMYKGEIIDVDNIQISFSEKDVKDLSGGEKKKGGRPAKATKAAPSDDDLVDALNDDGK